MGCLGVVFWCGVGVDVVVGWFGVVMIVVVLMFVGLVVLMGSEVGVLVSGVEVGFGSGVVMVGLDVVCGLIRVWEFMWLGSCSMNSMSNVIMLRVLLMI